jgi:hypothetical protein
MKTKPSLAGLLPSLVAAGLLTTVFSASSATNLIHRYSFNEAAGSTTVTDSVRGSNGVVRSTPIGTLPTFDGSQVTLDGVGGYIDLPNRMLSGLTNVTFEFWANYTAGGTWARLLDFGIAAIGEDLDGTLAVGTPASNYVFICFEPGPRFAITPLSNGNENQVNSGTPVAQGSGEHHLVVTYGPARTPSMYLDGNFVGSGNYTTPLSAITNDVNNWLGRSNWPDPFYGGSFNEFRMHSTQLSALEVLASRAAGPNTINYTPENPTSITLNVNSNMNSGQGQDATITGVFPTYGSVTVGAADATLVSSAPSIVSVGANNRLTAVNPGTATITASLGGQTNFGSITVTPPTVAVNQLKHRYSFNEAAGSTTANDSVGTAHATVVPSLGTTPPVVISNGMARFPGLGANATCGYITLPPNMLTTEFTNITVEFWFTWYAGANSTWQRVFDFGDSNKGADPHINNTGRDYIFFCPQRGGNGARNEFRATLDAGATYTSVFNDAPSAGPIGLPTSPTGFPTNQEVHVVCTFAPAINYSALYINGFRQNINTTPVIAGTQVQFSQMSSLNMWLGVSQWNDPPLAGDINELRLHEGLQNEVQIALSRQAGPDALPVTNPGALQSLSLLSPPLYINNPLTTQATLLGNFQNASNVDITPLTGVVLESSDTNIFTVSATGLMTPRAVGTASLIGSYSSLSTTSQVSVLAPTSVYVTALPATLDVGNPAHSPYTVPLLANFPGGISNVNVSGFTGVTRSSSDANVATITAAGVITVLNPGSTTITSTYWDQTNQAVLTVLAPISLSVTNLPTTREAGSVNFTVPLLAAYSDGNSNVVVTAAAGVGRASSNPNVATITGGGVVTVRSPGATTITSSYRGLTNQGTLTVVMPPNFVRGTLLHRYSFSEAPDTPTVDDSVGTADGTVEALQFGQTNGNFTGTGEFRFNPGPAVTIPITNSYINLPNGLISGLTSVTVEGWFTWFGGANNQHLFDFGMSSGAPDGSGGTSSTNFLEDFVLNPGRNYFFLSPQTGSPRFALDPDIGGGGTGETPSIGSSIAITLSNKSHFAVVYDYPRGVARLYVNGQRAGTGVATFPLSVVDDRNNWLGRSQWQDPFVNGSIDEFRIYNGPFLDTDIASHFAYGPNTLISFLPQLSFSVSGNQLTLSWPTSAGSGYTLKSTTVLGPGAVWSPAGGAPTVVGENYQVTVTVTSGNAFFRLEQ